ncbi:MAG: putative Ig domain-containing protein, partial [Spirochaetes bacterium]|nr:putative Ig domain-containing protein [Spirochaetota bacterium]
ATVNVGGTAAGTVTLDTSALPAGVTASVTGTTITVTGVRPASDQSAITGGPFSVTVTRENITQTFTVSVNLTPLPPPLEITTSVLPDGTANMVYPAQTLAATGDTPITWSVTGGSLPGGLSLNANTGVITGTPTAAGTFIFTVTAANAGNTATQELTIRVLPGATPPRITTEALPGGVVGQEYSQALVASGTAPITWSHSGSLPPGITRTGGVLSGTPTAAGTFTFTATASGTGTPPTHSRTFTIVITNVAQPPQIVSNEATMGSGTQGRGFSYTLEARGTAPFTWSHTGSLPPGMSFNDGVISGTPTAAGTHSFTVTATNDAGTHSGTLNLTIHPALVLGPGGVVYGFPGLTFTVVNGRLQVNGTYTGNSTNLIFPSEIGGIPLGNFTNHNFADNMDLQTVTIPSGVTIHVQTFAGANNLHTIIIGSNVTFSGNGTGGIIGPGGTPSTNFRDIYLSYGSQPGIFIRNTTTHVWSRQP